MTKAFHILSTGTWPGTVRKLQAGSQDGVSEFYWHEQAFIAIEPLQSPALLTSLKTLARCSLEVIFTSKHAVLAVSRLLNRFPDHWTANMLNGATRETFDGLYPQASGAAQGYYADELAAFIIREKPEKSFIFFCGDKRRDTLPDQLQRHGIDWQEIRVYKTALKPLVLERHFDGIVFFSPSAVESYFINNRPDSETILFAIGTTTASAIKPYWEGRIICPDFPDKTEMYHTVRNYFNTHYDDDASA